MLRLAHRLLWRTPSVREESTFNLANRDLLLRDLPSAQIIVCDNVATYAAAKLDNIEGLIARPHASPCLPPFDLLFVEFDTRPLHRDTDPSIRYRAYISGLLLANLTIVKDKVLEQLREDGVAVDHDLVKYVYRGLHASSNNAGEAGVLPSRTTILFDERGHLIEKHVQSEVDYVSEFSYATANIALLAMTFAHCKNVSKVDITEEAGPTRKWCRRMRIPELKYHALQIDPNLSAKPRSASASGGEDRSGKALHICRGHFKTYAEGGAGLFGKGRTGTFWVPSHTRGSDEHGQVTKSYTIGVPAA
jgi:hypothetical protein